MSDNMFSELDDWDPMAEDFENPVFNSYKDTRKYGTHDLTKLYIRDIPVSMDQDRFLSWMSSNGRKVKTYCFFPPRPDEITIAGIVGFYTEDMAAEAMRVLNASSMDLYVQYATRRMNEKAMLDHIRIWMPTQKPQHLKQNAYFNTKGQVGSEKSQKKNAMPREDSQKQIISMDVKQNPKHLQLTNIQEMIKKNRDTCKQVEAMGPPKSVPVKGNTPVYPVLEKLKSLQIFQAKMGPPKLVPVKDNKPVHPVLLKLKSLQIFQAKMGPPKLVPVKDNKPVHPVLLKLKSLQIYQHKL